MNLRVETFPVAPHPPFGHLLPREDAGEGQSDFRLLPFLPTGEGARRADGGPPLFHCHHDTKRGTV